MTLVVLQNKRPRRRAAPLPAGPVSGLLDPRFVYAPSLDTNIAKTFKRVRAELNRGERL